MRLRRRDPLGAAAAAFVAGALLAGWGWWSHGALRTRLDGLVRELGEAVIETTAASLRATDATLRALADESAESLRLKATFLPGAGRPEPMLDRFAFATGLSRVLLYDAEGRWRASGRDIPPPRAAEGLELVGRDTALEEAGRALVRELDGGPVLREWAGGRFGGEPLLAAAVRLPDGGAAVLVQDAAAFRSVRDAASPDALARRLQAETRIAYVRFGIDPPPADAAVIALTRTAGLRAPLHIGIDRGPVLSALAIHRESLVRQGALATLLVFVATWILLHARGVRTALASRRRQEERLLSLGRLAAGIAHEIRNPLNAIGLAAQRIQRDDDDAARLSEVVIDEVDRLNRTVADVLQYARPRHPRPGRVVARELLDAVAALARADAEAAGVTLSGEAAPDLAFRGDGDLLRGALWNLVRNALQASPRGGGVRVRWGVRGRTVELVVEDDGSGVPPAERERIFAPFYGGRADGTGLGLALALAAAQAHGGAIDVEGARFRLHFPYLEAPCNS